MAAQPVLPNVNYSLLESKAKANAPLRVRKLNNSGDRRVTVRHTRRCISTRFIFKNHYTYNKGLNFGLMYGMGPQSLARKGNL